MTHEEARKYYGIYSSTGVPKAVQLGRYLIMLHWGEDLWDTLTAKNECNTDWVALRKVRNLGGITAYQFVCWRMIITWGKIG